MSFAFNRTPLIVLISIVSSHGVASAQGQRLIEISEDGRTTVDLSHAALDSVTTGSGAGGVAAANPMPFGTAPDWQNALLRQVGALQFADINNDGWLDLVVGCFKSQSSTNYTDWRNFIHFNTGGQLEQNPSWFSADQVSTGDVQIADFNADGNLDILAANGGFPHSPSVIYFGTPNGAPDSNPGWTSATPQSTWALSAAAFDFDHDGDIDVITTNQSGIQGDNFRPLYLFRNTNGVVETSPSWQSQDVMISNGIDVGDYDNDGWEDIAVAKWVNFQCAIYKNNGGTFSALPAWTNGIAEGARGAAFHDLNSDGLLDVMYGLDPARLYQNNGDNSFAPVWTSAAAFPSAQEIRWHDVDFDGDQDYAEIHFSTGRLHIYQNNNGALDAAPTWTYDAPIVGNAFAFGDVNGDGCDDLAIAYSGNPSIVVFYAQCEKTQPCPADINDSGGVDVSDLLAVINAWGACPPPCPADVDASGAVDVSDLLAVINAWGECP